ncbi:MAG: phosphatase PAP2 family protein [Actinomycetota bacterium]
MSGLTRDIGGCAIGGAVLVDSAAIARRRVPALEVRAFRALNELPDGAFPFIWAPMQYGTFATVPVLSAIALARHRPRLAAALGVAGSAAWFLAKGLKPVVGRAWPVGVIGSVDVRGREEGDLGFPSGHAAVSAAITSEAWPYLSEGGRLAAVALCAWVAFGRLYIGAHLPLDVIGGAALGLALGCGGDMVLASRADPWSRTTTGTGATA